MHAKLPKRPAAAVLIITSLLALLAMGHHPTIESHSVELALREIGDERWINSAVHGFMLVVVVLYCWGFSVFNACLDRYRMSVGLAQVALVFATITMSAAAIISGFIVPEVAAKLLNSAERHDEFQSILTLLFSANQVLAMLGTVGYSVAIACWGVALIRAKRTLQQVVGTVGLLGSAGFLVYVLMGYMHLHVAGMTIFAAGLGVWASAAAALLWFESTDSD
ncbi:MAG: hypothetical protein AAGH65_00010 [Pseudomonadota bacterium]